jgi:hypothetical protein
VRIRYQALPVWPEPSDRQQSRFTASWPDTLELLDRELTFLGAEEVLIQAGFMEGAIRLDGYPRADAKTHHPGVILSFDSKHGLLRYGTDRFDDSRSWRSGRGYIAVPGYQANIRAIALSLEALRTVDRYGVTKRGEQYAGWRALPAGTGLTTAESARKLIATWARLDGEPDLDKLVRAALFNSHPDHGGNDDAFHQVQMARRMLDAL